MELGVLLKQLNKITAMCILSATFFLSLSVASFAEAPVKGEASVGSKSEKDKRKTSIDFEDELIQGEVKKPELFYLLQKKQFNFKRLIKLREDFLPEMRRTSQDIRRSGSGN